jgi:chlorobactene glucosyltransferase
MVLDYLLYTLVSHLVVFQAILLLIALSNIWLMHRARQHPPLQTSPKVSVLIPARNEEGSIAACVHSLLAQTYPAFEVLVLDDHSSDATLPILQELARADSRLAVLTGSALPTGWLGKSWACTQLALHSSGELLLFTDADTVFAPHALSELVRSMAGEGADMLTGFPRQQVVTWGERLLVPFFSWAACCFLPLALAYRVRMPGLSTAVGQLMLFRREAYALIGGHARIHTSIVEDLDLARQIKAAGLRWRVVEVADLISCRMYSGSRAALEGFAKNYFAAFGFRVLPYLFMFGWLAVMFWLPIALLGLWAAGGVAYLPQKVTELLASIALSLLLWLAPYISLRLPAWLALFYPPTLGVVFAVVVNSLFGSLSGRLQWKGRTLARPRWRWL